MASHSSPFVEITFDGEPPSLDLAGEITRDGNVLRLKTHDPSGAAAEMMNRLGSDVERVRDVEIMRPSLDSLYVALTEQRYSSGDAEAAGQPAPDGAARDSAPLATPGNR